jgi:hypothetical protein
MSEKKSPIDLSKVSDFDVQRLIIDRDCSQYRTERIDALLNEIGAQKGCNEAAKEGAKIGAAKEEISEEPLNALSYENGESDRGPYQAARLPQNNNASFQRCLNILKRNISEKAHTFSEKSWDHSYWLGDNGTAIFSRKKKTEKPASSQT